MLPMFASAAGSLFQGLGQGISGAMAEDGKMPESGAPGSSFISGPFTVGSRAVGRAAASGDTSASQHASAATGDGMPVGSASQAAVMAQAAGTGLPVYVAIGAAALALGFAFLVALKR